jgi:PIN domain nuclease of toxin-antitoxin system
MTARRTHLLDASALLAALFGEPGSDLVNGILDDCTIHAVNLAETMRKLLHTGVPLRKAENVISSLDLDVNTTLTTPEALAAGQLAFQARDIGLSIGDCVCLSVATQTGQTVVTADRRWSEITTATFGGRKVKILQIR